MNPQQRMEKLKRVIDSAIEKQNTMKGTCSDCRFARDVSYPYIATCRNPLAALNNLQIVSGTLDYPRCSDVRNRSGLCGPEGLLFEVDNRPLWFKRLFF